MHACLNPPTDSTRVLLLFHTCIPIPTCVHTPHHCLCHPRQRSVLFSTIHQCLAWVGNATQIYCCCWPSQDIHNILCVRCVHVKGHSRACLAGSPVVMQLASWRACLHTVHHFTCVQDTHLKREWCLLTSVTLGKPTSDTAHKCSKADCC